MQKDAVNNSKEMKKLEMQSKSIVGNIHDIEVQVKDNQKLVKHLQEKLIVNQFAQNEQLVMNQEKEKLEQKIDIYKSKEHLINDSLV